MQCCGSRKLHSNVLPNNFSFLQRKENQTKKKMHSKTRVSWLRRPSANVFRAQTEPANDQLPFLSRSRFSALPHFRATKPNEVDDNLSLFIAILYVVDMFGVFPFVTLPALLVQLGFFGIPLVISVVVLQIYTSFLLSECWTMAEGLDSSIVHKNRWVNDWTCRCGKVFQI